MRKRGKKYTDAVKQLDLERTYTLEEAAKALKSVDFVNFDASMDLSIRLGVDPRKANQMVRGTASLPHGTGKDVRVLVLTNPEKEQAARDAGADHVGLDDYIEKIQNGWVDVDVIICSPDVMPKVGRLGRILGPRGLMPNPKSGTVAQDVGKAVQEVKAGKIDFKVDKTGIINTSIGKRSFSPDQIAENGAEVLRTIAGLRPQELKGNYFINSHLSTTMGPGLKIDITSVPEL
jgi:large subunit ribosomal protein L1